MNHFLPPKLQALIRTWDVSDELLERLIAIMWDKPELSQLKVWIARGTLEAYMVDGRGLVLLETSDWVRGRELNIYGMVGSGILKRGEAILADLKLIAKHKACSMLGGHGIPKGWIKVGEKHGFHQVSIHYSMEIN